MEKHSALLIFFICLFDAAAFRKCCFVSRSGGRFLFIFLHHIFCSPTDTCTFKISACPPFSFPSSLSLHVWTQAQQTSRLPGPTGILGNPGCEKRNGRETVFLVTENLYAHLTPDMLLYTQLKHRLSEACRQTTCSLSPLNRGDTESICVHLFIHLLRQRPAILAAEHRA